MERPRLLPEENWGIRIQGVEDSRKVKDIIKLHYPNVRHHLTFNASTPGTVYWVNNQQYCDCKEVLRVQKDLTHIKIYSLEEFQQLIKDSEKPVDQVINNYPIY